MSVKPLDTLLAIKALGVVEGLSANDRRVAATIVEHFNRRTGRCDPGLPRIATLLGISERTVIRCVNRLVAAKLIRKTRHGGFGNRNSYEPLWDRFGEIQREWSERLRRRAREPNLSPAPGQACHIPDDGVITQTCFNNNLPKATYSKWTSNEENRRSTNFSLRETTTGKSSSDAAWDAAERRWTSQLNSRYSALPVTYAEIIEAITEEIRFTATEAEKQRRGDGLGYIIRQLKLGGGR